jgi:hypothetical protein
MPARRTLAFAGLDDVLPEVERLLAGHTTGGRWTLGQICNHLATAIRLTLDVPVRPAEPTREQNIARRRFFRQGKFPEGMEAPIPVLLPRPDLDARKEADALQKAIARLVAAPGPLPGHPRLGPLTRDEWVRFHCMHCAHHLAFAVPTAAIDTTRAP